LGQQPSQEDAVNAKKIMASLVTVGCLGILAVPSLAQQPSQSPASSPPSAAGRATTIDCPPAAVAGAPSGQVVNPPGSGLATMPSTTPSQRVEGPIKAIGSTRTNRIVEVGEVKLEVEPSTVVLVGCKPASVADLKVGKKIKAVYQMKEPNRQLATVIEAQN
jgi:hypothetical protein